MNILYILVKIAKKLRGSAIFNSSVHPTSKVESGSSIVRVTIDRHSFCGYDCTIVDTVVGPFSSIGTRVTIGGASHPMHFVSTSPAFLSHADSIKTKLARHHFLPINTTYIGADVWIGDGAYVKAGIRIGTGAVIGMGAVVTHDVDAYSIVAGNPARFIRRRFSEEVCAALIDSEWWKMNDADLLNLGHLINKPEEFIAEVSRGKA